MSEEFAPSRRQFFLAGAVAAAALPGASSVTMLGGKPFEMLDLAEWKAHVGKQFVLDGKTQMTLVAVKLGSRQGEAGRKRQNNFTAVFETEHEVAADGLYRVANAELGHTDLYLQPGMSKRGAPTMRATFS